MVQWIILQEAEWSRKTKVLLIKGLIKVADGPTSERIYVRYMYRL